MTLSEIEFVSRTNICILWTGNSRRNIRGIAYLLSICYSSGLAFILPLIAMLSKEPEVLQPGAFFEHTMQQNGTAEGLHPRYRGEAYSTPDSPAGFKGATSWREEKGRREGGEGEGRLTLMRSWNRAADWLRPALSPILIMLVQ